LDCFNNKFIMVGPGGYELKLSPGSETYELEESPAGHLMLPCSKYSAAGSPHDAGASTVFAIDGEAAVADHADL
jgi:hypothetical protein